MIKKTLAGLLICCTPLLASAVELVPPNMAIGLWENTVDQTGLVEQLLASVPKEQQAMARTMIEQEMENIGTTQQCITAEMLSTFDEQIRNTLSENQACEFNISESSGDVFAAEVSCPNTTINILTTVINPKRSESKIITTSGGLEATTITSVSEWQSAVCPEGL